MSSLPAGGPQVGKGRRWAARLGQAFRRSATRRGAKPPGLRENEVVRNSKKGLQPDQASTCIGCSGWLYRHWRGDFYPAGLRQKDEFAFYAERFDTAEINNSFYRLPSESAVAKWAEAAPEGFVFAWKYPRWLTHYYRLKDPAESYALVFGRMALLGSALGPVLFQLPPQMKCDRERLARALDLLPPGVRAAYEFRHPSWYEPPILDLLREHGAALCVSDHHHAPAPWEATADFAYVRGHGSGGRYHGDYPDEDLEAWVGAVRRWSGEGRAVFAYFDNDIGGAAPRDALRLKARLATL